MCLWPPSLSHQAAVGAIFCVHQRKERGHCLKFEWLKMKEGNFLGLEISVGSLHLITNFAVLGETQFVLEEGRM
jgi:hypothetical protein